MRKFLVAVLASAFVLSASSGVFASFSGTSVRMQGINPNLVGIVSDEYSDALSINPADLLNVSGYRVYTNMSNLYSGNTLGNDRALNGTTTGGLGSGQFLLGAFGNPLSGILPDSQMGLLYNSGSTLTAGVNNLVGVLGLPTALGESVLNVTQQYDKNNDGDYADPDDWTLYRNQKANRELETFGSDYDVLFAKKLFGNIKLGAEVFYDDADINGKPSSRESITASDYQQKTVNATPNKVTTHDYSLNAKEDLKNNTMRLRGGVRYGLLDNLTVGGRVGVISTSQERKRESTAKIKIDLSQEVTADKGPITAEVTAVDGDLETLPGIFGVLGGAVTAGFNWTGLVITDWGLFDTSTWQGITGDEVGSAKADGTGVEFVADSYYKVRNATLTGRINYQSIPQKLSANLSRPYYEVYYTSNAAVAGGIRKDSEDNLRSYAVSGDITNNNIALTLGGQADLKKNVILGFGAIYSIGQVKTSGNYTMTRKDITIVDTDNDGSVVNDGVADSRKTVEDTDTASFASETNTDQFQIPIGLEMRPWKPFAVRLGVTHTIVRTKMTNTSVIISDGLTKTTEEKNGTSTITYEVTPGVVGKKTGAETTAVNTTIARTTQYYYGIGYDWSENLSFDILGLSGAGTGAGILDLASWRISATLKF